MFCNTPFLHFHTVHHTSSSLFYIDTVAKIFIFTFSLIMTKVRSKTSLVFTVSFYFKLFKKTFTYKNVFIPILGHQHCGSEWRSQRSFLQVMTYYIGKTARTLHLEAVLKLMLFVNIESAKKQQSNEENIHSSTRVYLVSLDYEISFPHIICHNRLLI